jgi:hypothetical protein
MARSFSVLALLLAACPPADTGTVDTDPLVDCDRDDDGFDGGQCHGPDCDDADPSVAPGAVELAGDDVDQDCDGRVDLGAPAAVDIPTPVGRWSFRPDLRAIGGMTSGRFILWPTTVTLDDDGGTEAVIGEPWGYNLDISQPLRVWAGDGPIDVILARTSSDEQQVLAWIGDAPSAPVVLMTTAGDGLTSIGAATSAGRLQVTTCGGGALHWLAASGGVQGTASTEATAERCVPLAGGDRQLVLGGSADPGRLVRWRVTDDAFDGGTTLGNSVDLEPMATSTVGASSLYAYVSDGRIWVFDLGANGVVLDLGDEVVSSMEIASDGGSDYIVGWVNTDDQLRVAWGTLGEDERRLDVGEVVGNRPFAVGISATELAVASPTARGLEISRAQR